MTEITLKIPDIGGATDVEVIEILVQVGDEIAIDGSLITLETDKASMDIPAAQAGKVSKILVKVGDKVAENDPILVIESEEKEQAPSADSQPVSDEPKTSPEENKSEPVTNDSETKTHQLSIPIPDIGGAEDVDVIEILVKEGEAVQKDQSLITLEGDKATMDIPSPEEGLVKEIKLKVGDKVSKGSVILILESARAQSASKESNTSKETTTTEKVEDDKKNTVPSSTEINQTLAPSQSLTNSSSTDKIIFAGPSVRRQARELGVDLSQVQGSGRKSRITKDDLIGYVKNRLSEKATGSGLVIASAPVINFAKFGAVETKPLNKIKRLTGVNVHRSWITIPHVTQFDEADITELEAFRKAEQSNPEQSVKLTILAFVTKVIYKALVKFPQFNASLDSTGEQLILKHYFNIGIAVETPNGLVVPVIKQVDQLSVSEIATKMSELSKQAREKGITPADMSGGCFTISSLGGIGGTAFTPIVNAPEVAILGLSRSQIKPVFVGNEFKPRLMLPLSLSYDHRVIDGAEAARFTRFIAEQLGDIRRILL